MKRFFNSTTILILATALLISGCGSDSDEACAYAVEQDLDQGNYDSVISTLDNNGTCNGALSQIDAWMNAGAAYMGTAGLTMSSLLGSVLDSNSSDAMTGFMTSFASSATSEGLNALNSAQTIYGYIATNEGVVCANLDPLTASSAAKAACLNNTLVVMTQAVGTLSAVLGDLSLLTADISGTENDVNDNNSSDEIEVTSCAVAEAGLDGPRVCASETSIAYADDANVTFTDGTVSLNVIPRSFTVAASGAGLSFGDKTYYKLIDRSGLVASPVTTSGVCKTDFSIVDCGEDVNVSTGCYPCPVVIDGATSTTTEGLLDIINGGELDALTALLPADDSGTDLNISADLIESIEGAGGDGTISEQELADFLSTL